MSRATYAQKKVPGAYWLAKVLVVFIGLGAFGAFGSTQVFAQSANPTDAVWANENIEAPEFADVVEVPSEIDPDSLEAETPFGEDSSDESAWSELEEPEEFTRPRGWALSTRLGLGLGLRIGKKNEFQQDVLSPAYFSLAGGVVVPSGMHELRVGVASNLNRDGTYPSGVLPFHQWTITPSYVLRIPVTREFAYGADSLRRVEVTRGIAGGRLGVPIVLGGNGSTFGVELAAFGQYNVLSGFGIYAELGFDVFLGAGTRDKALTTHMLVFAELGISIDWEISL